MNDRMTVCLLYCILYLDKLRSTLRAKKATKNRATKAIETILGFCR